jgi:CDP-glucose 4,6-dehydratase
MAAQALVRYSYAKPVETYATNVMGTVNLLEAVRHARHQGGGQRHQRQVLRKPEWAWGYRENEAMGGYDPYSNSKGCAELVTAGYRSVVLQS